MVVDTVEFSVPGPPASWHVYTRWDKSASKARLKAYQEHIRLCARVAMGNRDPHDGPVDLTIHFYKEIPASAPKGEAARKRWCDNHILKSPDASNLGKGAEDSLNRIVFVDDSQVIQKQITKGYREDPETIFLVRLL